MSLTDVIYIEDFLGKRREVPTELKSGDKIRFSDSSDYYSVSVPLDGATYTITGVPLELD